MIREGDMVRAGSGPIMRVVTVFEDSARCIFVDGHGRIQSRWRMLDDLNPFWLSFSPRCLWPDVSDLPDHVVPSSAVRKKSTKPKRSRRARSV